MKHLISIEDLSQKDIELFLSTAKRFEDKGYPQGEFLLFNMFFEPSTRTRISFELAARRLGGQVLNFHTVSSSIIKGESVKDTLLTVAQYDPNIIVIRHSEDGVPELATNYLDCHVVNAGDGTNQHPTQALLDLYTVQQEFGHIEGLRVAFVGDVLHSRVARSDMQAFTTCGASVIAVSPKQLLPHYNCEKSTDIKDIKDADIVYILRIQKERFASDFDYGDWCVTKDKLAAGQRIMHPGPINRGVEIDSDVADSVNSLILQQVRSGLAIRASVLYTLMERT